MSVTCEKSIDRDFRPGEHVPVRAVDEQGETIDVFCQNCMTPMSAQAHKDYFDEFYKWFEEKFGEPYGSFYER